MAGVLALHGGFSTLHSAMMLRPNANKPLNACSASVPPVSGTERGTLGLLRPLSSCTT